MLTLDLAEPIAAASSWMLTYLIHSTILILAVWLICRGIRPLAKRIGPGGENLGWKLALLGGFVTATVQVAAGVTPALGALELETGPKLVEQQRVESQPELAPAPARRVVIRQDGEAVTLGASPAPAASVGPSGAEVAAAPVNSPAPLWPKLLLVAWMIGALVALVRLALSVRTLRRRLAERSEVLEDPVLESFLTLCRDTEINRKIRLTQSANIGSPIALWRAEIVVPQRAVEELSPAAMRAVLGHELAHLQRRDPHWLAIAAVIESLFFFQPLNRLARRGMQESAELLCDDWAIAQTGDGVQFAKSLAEVATWTKARGSSLLLAGMVSSQRPLVRRVRRALDGDPLRFEQNEGARATRMLVGLATLSALIMVAPGAVDASPPQQPPAPDPTRPDLRASAASDAHEAREQAEREAIAAAARAREAREVAERAEQAAREAERAAREAEAQARGRQHLTIRDGDDYLIIDERGVRLRSPDANIEILDGANPRMRVRVHEDDLNIDLDLDLDTLESMAGIIAGELFGEELAPGPQGFDGGWGSGWDVWGDALGGQLDPEALERELEAARRELEEQARELERGLREQRRNPRSVAPPS
ncbi:M56 family metallopeptidase, partial [Enhygromyxa salina]|uniref:M56 family metallopeptidase n=1 Tax=Enhygromyxa salina TaxID=215803 RepID=UPI0011B21B19